MPKINPTIGRRLWFWPAPESYGSISRGSDNFATQPCDAGVAFVHSAEMVNISYADHNGVMQSATSVPLWQGEGERPSSFFCEWMDYQKQMAAKEAAAG